MYSGIIPSGARDWTVFKESATVLFLWHLAILFLCLRETLKIILRFSQGLLLIMCSGVTLGEAQLTIWDAGE